MKGEKDALYFHLVSTIPPSKKLSCKREYQRKVFYLDHLSRAGLTPAGYGDFFVVESTDSFNRE